MIKLTHLFDEQDRQRINATLTDAQAKTATPILPVVAAASGRYDRAEDLFGLLLGVLAAAGVWVFLPNAEPTGDSWAGYTATTKITLMGVALLAGFVLGVMVASRVWVFRRPFIPKAEMRDSVTRGASTAFFDLSLRQGQGGSSPSDTPTAANGSEPAQEDSAPDEPDDQNQRSAASEGEVHSGDRSEGGRSSMGDAGGASGEVVPGGALSGGGLLIYVSIAERRAAVLADHGVLEALGQPVLDAMCRDLTDLLADTDPTEALCQTIRRAGEHLSAFSPTADTAHHQSNELVLLG